MDEHKGWFSRGHLPHFDAGEVTQFITFRLADSLPRELIDRLSQELNEEDFAERREEIERLLDLGSGSCILRIPKAAELVQNAILFLNGKRYDLTAWVVMPNHVHLLAKFGPGQSLPKAMHSLKSYTANQLRAFANDTGSIWQREYFDRYIRTEEHFSRTLGYIHDNPVKANLCGLPEEYPWSSAFIQHS